MEILSHGKKINRPLPIHIKAKYNLGFFSSLYFPRFFDWTNLIKTVENFSRKFFYLDIIGNKNDNMHFIKRLKIFPEFFLLRLTL